MTEKPRRPKYKAVAEALRSDLRGTEQELREALMRQRHLTDAAAEGQLALAEAQHKASRAVLLSVGLAILNLLTVLFTITLL